MLKKRVKQLVMLYSIITILVCIFGNLFNIKADNRSCDLEVGDVITNDDRLSSNCSQAAYGYNIYYYDQDRIELQSTDSYTYNSAADITKLRTYNDENNSAETSALTSDDPIIFQQNHNAGFMGWKVVNVDGYCMGVCTYNTSWVSVIPVYASIANLTNENLIKNDSADIKLSIPNDENIDKSELTYSWYVTASSNSENVSIPTKNINNVEQDTDGNYLFSYDLDNQSLLTDILYANEGDSLEFDEIPNNDNKICLADIYYSTDGKIPTHRDNSVYNTEEYNNGHHKYTFSVIGSYIAEIRCDNFYNSDILDVKISNIKLNRASGLKIVGDTDTLNVSPTENSEYYNEESEFYGIVSSHNTDYKSNTVKLKFVEPSPTSTSTPTPSPQPTTPAITNPNTFGTLELAVSLIVIIILATITVKYYGVLIKRKIKK